MTDGARIFGDHLGWRLFFVDLVTYKQWQVLKNVSIPHLATYFAGKIGHQWMKRVSWKKRHWMGNTMYCFSLCHVFILKYLPHYGTRRTDNWIVFHNKTKTIQMVMKILQKNKEKAWMLSGMGKYGCWKNLHSIYFVKRILCVLIVMPYGHNRQIVILFFWIHNETN